ncbi:MAG: endonuclease domain-containing protein, partial [Alphaproteobacteria bacterium]|nr:endonuclease domain-containing protein [Alphaproteobacteria bacterium]
IKLSKYADFLFKSYHFDSKSGLLRLDYAFSGGPEFQELIEFPLPVSPLSESQIKAFDHALRLVFLLAGISYYKAYVPERLRCLAFTIDVQMAAFLKRTYRGGLGEFSYKNEIKINPRFSVEEGEVFSGVPLTLGEHSLVAVGGGKDSTVSVECLKKSGAQVTMFAVSGGGQLAAPIRDTMDVAGAESLIVRRTLSPQLLELNKQDALNGHVPITAIVSAIAVACAVLHGFKNIIFSNEHSASAPNVKVGDFEVNHQFSKSLAFETEFAAVVRARVSADLAYFSLLRPLTETEIARRFARLEAYHPVFRSCNTAFKQDEKLRGKNWCCNCPKCRFVFLALAPFMEKDKLVGIFGANLLADAAQIEDFGDLCGFSPVKPFECVGEVEESALLMGRLFRMDAWKNDAVVAALGAKVTFDERAFEALLENKPEHGVPDRFMGMLNACR